MKNKKPNKRLYASTLEEANHNLDKYLYWLEDTGRLTSEERIKLVNLSNDCESKAISFGYGGELM